MKRLRYFPVLLILLVIPHLAEAQVESYTIKKTRFSSKNSDEFSPVYYKDGLVFCSNMSRSLVKNYLTTDDKGLLNIVFADTLNWKVRLFARELRTMFNDGPASFSRNGDTVYFSRNIRTDVNRDDASPRNKLGIFTSVLEDGTWGKILDFRFNNEYYNITTPFISPDGKRLFFAADNPEGMGGTDIYYCDWKGDYWDDPVNMGPEVNTKGNESYPTVNSEGGVFFSSDGHPGLGGKDIFYTRQADDGKWLPPVHLNAPVNSKYDDFSLVADPMMNSGYFATNREGTVDIYKFRTNVPQLFYCDRQRENQYCFSFSDNDKIFVDTRYLELLWNFGDGSTATGPDAEHCFKGPGKYQVRLDARDKKTGHVVFTKLAFDLDLRDIEQSVILSPLSAMAGEQVTLDGLTSSFEGSTVMNYTWHLGDGQYSKEGKLQHTFDRAGDYDIRLGLKVRNDKTGVIRELCSVKPIKIFSNAGEKEAFDRQNAEPAPVVDIFEYNHAVKTNRYSAEDELSGFAVYRLEILRSETQLDKNDEAFRKLPGKYILKENFLSEENIYSYTVAEEHTLMATYPSYRELAELGFTDAKVYQAEVEDAAERELNNLEKAFGVSADALFVRNTQTLSSTGTQLLDLVMGFMAKYPAIRLQIACHSDNTGSAAANLTLTNRRAETMVNYLVINGVNRNRLVPMGLGGTMPIAPNYQESDRKNNRRVDFTIL
ncbi:MAG TPA: PKD domain-containing protein [Bacteroidales bacterium]|nr:PKD domain-containing protein [Bacteroidales bacterium]HQB87264.1 PKD domain-containing protein [Bacteroidales bacterium]